VRDRRINDGIIHPQPFEITPLLPLLECEEAVGVEEILI